MVYDTNDVEISGLSGIAPHMRSKSASSCGGRPAARAAESSPLGARNLSSASAISRARAIATLSSLYVFASRVRIVRPELDMVLPLVKEVLGTYLDVSGRCHGALRGASSKVLGSS